MDFSSILRDKTQSIIKRWVKEVQQDGAIKSSQTLTYSSVRNSLPYVLKVIVTLLDRSSGSSEKPSLMQKSIEHGMLRAEQDYDPEELGREYRILRQIIFEELYKEINLTNQELNRLVQSHQENIAYLADELKIKSEVNAGSTFTVTLPLQVKNPTSPT